MHALIFDIDGTLTETNGVDNVCFVRAVEAVLQVPGISTDWDQYPQVTDQAIVEELFRQSRGVAITPPEVVEFEEHFMSLLRQQPGSLFPELPGAGEFITLLKSQHVPVALATGSWRASALLKLAQGGIDHSDVPLSTASEAAGREEIMTKARDALLARHGCESFDRITSFGDAPWDVRAAQQLGWEFVGIGARIASLREMGVTRVFADYSAPEEILEALNLAW